MSFPRATIWPKMLEMAIDAVPQGSLITPTRQVTLADWRTAGFYRVNSLSGGTFSLETAGPEIGRALLTDTEFLLDSATEHRVSMWSSFQSERWQSPAWHVVTLYYWAFYCALALTRLTGKTVLFLDKTAANELCRLLPTPTTQNIGGGSFVLSCGEYISSTDREITVRKTKGRLHETVWAQLFSLITSLNSHASGNASHLEDRLYAAFVKCSTTLGKDWPSQFRNAVNYRTGFGYTAVRHVNSLDSFSYLRRPSGSDVAEIIPRFESNVLHCISVDEDPIVMCRLLADLAFLLNAMAIRLLDELIERNQFDARIAHFRQNFVREHGAPNWPLS